MYYYKIVGAVLAFWLSPYYKIVGVGVLALWLSLLLLLFKRLCGAPETHVLFVATPPLHIGSTHVLFVATTIRVSEVHILQ